MSGLVTQEDLDAYSSPNYRVNGHNRDDENALVFNLTLEEDIEAELEDFVLRARLGHVQEAEDFHNLILKKHENLFPVFGELVAFYMDIDKEQSLVQLVQRLESTKIVFNSPEKRELVYFLKRITQDIESDNLRPGAHNDYLESLTSYLVTLSNSSQQSNSDQSVLSSPGVSLLAPSISNTDVDQVQICEALLYGSAKTFTDGNSFVRLAEEYFTLMLEHSLYWEAVQVVSIVTRASCSAIFGALVPFDVIERMCNRLSSLSTSHSGDNDEIEMVSIKAQLVLLRTSILSENGDIFEPLSRGLRHTSRQEEVFSHHEQLCKRLVSTEPFFRHHYWCDENEINVQTSALLFNRDLSGALHDRSTDSGYYSFGPKPHRSRYA